MKTAVFALYVSLLAASAAAYAARTPGIPNLTDITIDGGGSVIHMDQIEAENYCQSQGSRLPTIRELALWATQYGAKISDTPQNGYDEIDGMDSAGKPDTFYFQYSGYKAPQGELGYSWYWSSSVRRSDSFGAYYLDGSNGFIIMTDRDDAFDDVNYAVRCVRSR